MEIPGPGEMIEQISALPAAAPLLAALGERPGVHLVGGAVRDLLRGHPPVDLDVVVEGDALALARELGGEVRAHGRFGTVTVRLGGHSYDLAGARRERYDHPGALPDVAPAGLDEDLARRDFTVNAIAVTLAGPAAGTVHAVPEALSDLAGARLRVLHAGSFIDDPTRLLRLVRYATRLGFAIEPKTDALAAAAVAGGAPATVSGPRIGTELRLAAAEPDPVSAWARLARWELDQAIEPGLRLADAPLGRAALALAPGETRSDLLVVAVAGRTIEAARLGATLDRLGWRAPERDAIVAAATGAQALADRLTRAQRPSAIARAVAGAPAEAVALAGSLGPATAARHWLTELRHVRLEIAGSDLIGAGIAPGPPLGRALRAALAAKLDGDVSDRAGELAVARDAARRAADPEP